MAQAAQMSTLVVTVLDAVTKNPLRYVHVDAGGIVSTTGLDGTTTFSFPLGQTVVVNVRQMLYRPWSRSVPLTAARVPVQADLEKASL